MHSRLKRIIQELAETNGDLIETKIADTIIKNSAQNNPELNLQAEKLIEMLKKKIFIFRKRQQIIDELRLI